MKAYVLGFYFCDDSVALITKNRPDWQAGKLNGIGGHIEEGEKPSDAMSREFMEEAGAEVDWQFFCSMVFDEAVVYCYKAFGCSELEQLTDEIIDWYPFKDIPDNAIPNLRWLIPLALSCEEYMEHADLRDTGLRQIVTKPT